MLNFSVNTEDTFKEGQTYFLSSASKLFAEVVTTLFGLKAEQIIEEKQANLESINQIGLFKLACWSVAG